MKYCTHCGKGNVDEAIACVDCGCSIKANKYRDKEGLLKAARFFMIFSIIAIIAISVIALIYLSSLQSSTTTIGGKTVSVDRPNALIAIIYLLPLCWEIPMSLHLKKLIKNKQYISPTFKICTLIFANLISGICLLCTSNEDTPSKKKSPFFHFR